MSGVRVVVVTGVAADTSGRFGESTAEFATRGGLNLYAALPQFLRQGDEAQASVRLSAGEASKGTQNLDVKLAAAGVLEAAQDSQKVTLAKGGEQVLPITLKAKSAGAAELALSTVGAGRTALAVDRASARETVPEAALTRVIDRSFVEDGVRWIIDWKTAALGADADAATSSAALEERLAAHAERYRAQLESYAGFFAAEGLLD